MGNPDAATAKPARRLIRASFDMLRRDEEPIEDETATDLASGPRLKQVTIHKRYIGTIDGTGVARVLLAEGSPGSGYVASERVVGVVEGRSGSFVIQHNGIADGNDLTVTGVIVPHSGTGELANISGLAYEAEMGVLSLELD